MSKYVGVIWDAIKEDLNDKTLTYDCKSFIKYEDALRYAQDELCFGLYDQEAMLEAALASGDNPKSDCYEDIWDDIKADIPKHYNNKIKDCWDYPEHNIRVRVECYPVNIDD